MGSFAIILMAVLGAWAVFTTVLSAVWGRALRLEREQHEASREHIIRYRTAYKRTEEKAATLSMHLDALQNQYLELQRAIEDRDKTPVERPVPMLMIDSLDISGEVGVLMEHVARVATTIRGYSAYTRGHYGAEHSKARYDLLWLADCLHTYDRIGKALASGSQRALLAACQELLAMYEAYPRDGSGYDSRDTFRRLGDQVPLAAVSEALRSIALKTATPEPVAAAAAAPVITTAAALAPAEQMI
jgi:hypothetical protein